MTRIFFTFKQFSFLLNQDQIKHAKLQTHQFLIKDLTNSNYREGLLNKYCDDFPCIWVLTIFLISSAEISLAISPEEEHL